MDGQPDQHQRLESAEEDNQLLICRGKDKVTVLVESYRFYGIKLPFLFHKVTVFGPKLPFFVGPKLPFIWDRVTVFRRKLPLFWHKVTVMKVTVLR